MTADPFERHTPGALLSVCTDDPPSDDIRRALADLAAVGRMVVGPGSWSGFALADAPAGQRCCRLYVTRTTARDNYARDWSAAIHGALADIAGVVAEVPLPYPLTQRAALAMARFWSAVADVHALTGAP